MSAAPRRVYLHIGLPKTGTTFLQELLEANRPLLAEQGLLYPLPYREAMFHGAIELRGTYEKWGLTEKQVSGAWERVCAPARAHPGSSLISHENLSAMRPDQVDAALLALSGLEVHVVVTVRDLGRQIPAGWQEGVKSGSSASYERFTSQLLTDLDSGERNHRFWRMQDLPAVLAPWVDRVGADRIHVVTCPPRGADPWELWRRFAEAVGLDPARTPERSRVRTNESLGVAAIALLRDVNDDLRGRLDPLSYRMVVKRGLAQRMLPAHVSRRPTSPSGPLHDHVDALAREWVDYVRRSGFAVHGELEDLVPSPPPEGEEGPDVVTEAEKYDAARLAVAELVQEIARLQARYESSRSVRAGRLLRRLVGRGTPREAAGEDDPAG
ncbi:hypothetical protein [Nocardioides caldifontis]|uniref:hypothetical protein n=1 Tax=Nocardioides caldifontis TaxID=2588938 RepID=UPI0011DFFB75|nr:hypothetical protein [Nocardioides caldifontis]